MSYVKEFSVINLLEQTGLNGHNLKIVLNSLNFDYNKKVKDLTKDNLINLFAIENTDKIKIKNIGD
jgi:hypothetical protein